MGTEKLDWLRVAVGREMSVWVWSMRSVLGAMLDTLGCIPYCGLSVHYAREEMGV